MIYQKIQKNEENPNMKKAKGWALCRLAHDLEKGCDYVIAASF